MPNLQGSSELQQEPQLTEDVQVLQQKIRDCLGGLKDFKTLWHHNIDHDNEPRAILVGSWGSSAGMKQNELEKHLASELHKNTIQLFTKVGGKEGLKIFDKAILATGGEATTTVENGGKTGITALDAYMALFLSGVAEELVKKPEIEEEDMEMNTQQLQTALEKLYAITSGTYNSIASSVNAVQGFTRSNLLNQAKLNITALIEAADMERIQAMTQATAVVKEELCPVVLALFQKVGGERAKSIFDATIENLEPIYVQGHHIKNPKPFSIFELEDFPEEERAVMEFLETLLWRYVIEHYEPSLQKTPTPDTT